MFESRLHYDLHVNISLNLLYILLCLTIIKNLLPNIKLPADSNNNDLTLYEHQHLLDIPAFCYTAISMYLAGVCSMGKSSCVKSGLCHYCCRFWIFSFSLVMFSTQSLCPVSEMCLVELILA